MELHTNFTLCYKLGKTATETHEMLVQVYGREAVSRIRVYEWCKFFREGKVTTEDEPRSCRPSTSRSPEMIEKMRQMLAQDRRLTLILIVEELGISKNTVHTIVRDDLGKRKICSRFVPHKLLLTSSCFPAWRQPSKMHVLLTWMPSIPQEVFADCFRKLYERC